MYNCYLKFNLIFSGKEIILKTYSNIYVFSVSEGQSIQSALQNDRDRLHYNVEQQGESVTWTPDGHRFYTVSEGQYSDIWLYNKTVIQNLPSHTGYRDFLEIAMADSSICNAILN